MADFISIIPNIWKCIDFVNPPDFAGFRRVQTGETPVPPPDRPLKPGVTACFSRKRQPCIHTAAKDLPISQGLHLRNAIGLPHITLYMFKKHKAWP